MVILMSERVLQGRFGRDRRFTTFSRGMFQTLGLLQEHAIAGPQDAIITTTVCGPSILGDVCTLTGYVEVPSHGHL